MTQDKELVVRALRRLAEETHGREDPAAHPSVEELVAYHADELSPEEDRAIQSHLAVCAECPGLILALDSFAKLPEEELEITRTGVDSAWEKVRQRLAAEGWFQGETRRVSRPWAALSPPSRLVATVAVVVLSFLGLYLALYAPAAWRPRIVDPQEAGTPPWDLRPAVRDGEPPQGVEVSNSAASFFLEATPEGPRHTAYDVELWTAGPAGRRRWSARWQPKPGPADLVVEIPRGFLPAGDYRLELYAREGDLRLAEPPDERRFRLSYH